MGKINIPLWIFPLMGLCFLATMPIQAQKTDVQEFPRSWIGNWAGTLEIYAATGKVMEVPMQLRIQPTADSSRYQMHIIYGVDTIAGLRPYELVVLDPAKGLYAIDEKNSIVMESFLLGDKLYNRFEVQGYLLLSTTELIGDKLAFEVISGSTTPISITGGKAETDEIPPVKAYPVVSRQWALLQRR